MYSKSLKNKLLFVLMVVCVFLSYSCAANEIAPTVNPRHTSTETSAIVEIHIPTDTPRLMAIQTSTITPVAVLPSVTSTPTFRTLTVTPTVDFLQTITGRIAFTNWKTGLIEMVDVNSDNWGHLTSRLCHFSYTVSWSPDGHWVAFDCAFESFENPEIYAVNISNGEIRQITNGPDKGTDISWSPDGKYIAYIDVKVDRSDDIIIVNVENGETQKLTYTSALEVKTSWSPDGKMIAFLRYDEVTLDSVARLMVMDFYTGEIKAVTDFPAGWSQLTWSPDSREIAFVSAEECGEIYVVNVDGSDLRQLTNIDVGCPLDPNWSPNGKYIAFNMSLDNTTDPWKQRLFILDLYGNSVYQVSPNREWEPLNPVWQPVPFLQVGHEYTLTEMGNYLNLRQTPSVKGAVLTQLMTGDIVTVLEGPVDADDYYWWKLQTEDGTEGWAVDMAGWYQPLTEP